MTFTRLLSACVLVSSLSAGGSASAEPGSRPSKPTAETPKSKAAASIRRRERTATILLYGGGGLGAGLVAYGKAKGDAKKKECDRLPDPSYEKADCQVEAARAAGVPMVVGGAVMIASAVAFFIVRPSAAEREAAKGAARLPRANLAVGADPKSKRYGATFQVRF